MASKYGGSSAIKKLPKWIWYWTFIASALVITDSVYVFSVEYGSNAPEIIKKLWGWYGTSDIQYSNTGDGITNSNGWIQTQSLFNIFEVFVQLLFLFVVKQGTFQSVLTIMSVSIATLWKTLIYMSIIYHSKDPVNMVPLLHCFGFQPLDENRATVLASIQQDNCPTQFFKFHFNFYWIICPMFVIFSCWKVICAGSNPNKDK